MTPGKMVYELQPKLDWDKGRAVLYLIDALGLDGDDVVPLYLGDDITDEDAFRALAGRGIGIFVGSQTIPSAPAAPPPRIRAGHGRRRSRLPRRLGAAERHRGSTTGG